MKTIHKRKYSKKYLFCYRAKKIGEMLAMLGMLLYWTVGIPWIVWLVESGTI